MGEIERTLSQELTRIISCPYPASLATLDDILGRADVQTVQTCIRDRPHCAVSKLADIVAGALGLWPYTLRILHALCHSFEFRDIVLSREPSLLNTLLTKANSSQSDFDEYAELCVLLLSRPLPEVVSLPASAQDFFLRVFDKANRAPDVQKIKPVYSMLRGACRGLLTLTSSEARAAFDEKLCHILTSREVIENSMMLLWCVGIVILVEHPNVVELTVAPIPFSASDSQSQDPPQKRPKTAAGRIVFGSTKALYRTINLTHLSVVWALKGNVGVSNDEAIEGIRIAIQAMLFIDPEMRERWRDLGTRERANFSRLPAKIQQKDIDPTAQLQALCVHAMIAGENNLVPAMVEQYEKAFLRVMNLQTDADSLKEAILVSLPLFASQLQQSTIRQILTEILKTGFSSQVSCALRNVSVIVDELAALIPNCVSLQSSLSLAMSSMEIRQDLQKLLGATVDPSCHALKESDCDGSVEDLRRKLKSATISMLLTLALTTTPTENGLSQTIAIALLSKQRQLAEIPSECNHHTSIAQPTAVSLFEQECTPATGLHQRGWRDCLNSELERQSYYQRDALMRSVTLICSGLESRCMNVEEPLRCEREKVKDLAAEAIELQEQVKKLETEAFDRQMIMESREIDFDNVENERARLSSSLHDLKVEFDNAKRQANEILRAAKDDFFAKEAQLKSIILTHKESWDLCAQEVEDLNREKIQLEEELRKGRDEYESLADLHTALETRFDSIGQALETERVTTSTQAEEINRLKYTESDLHGRLKRAEEDLRATIAERNESQTRNEKLERTSEQALQALTTKHHNDIEVATAKATEERNRLHAELDDACQKAQQAKTALEDTQRDFQHVKAKVHALEDEIQELTEACSEKDGQLSDLQSYQKACQNALLNLANMGGVANHLLPTGDGFRADNARASRPHSRRKTTPQPEDKAPLDGTSGTQGITNTAMEHIANASFASSDSYSQNGPTPKRSKPQRSFKIPEMHTPYNQKQGLISKSLSKRLSPSKRPALHDVSPNRRHTTVNFTFKANKEDEANEATEKRRGSLHSDIDMDGILASSPAFTPGNFICSTGREPEEETTEL